MIDVPELDLFLKTWFYIFNSDREIYRNLNLSDNLRSRINYFFNNPLMLNLFENTVQRPEFGFDFELGRVDSMYGVREVLGLRDPYLVLPAQFLKVYPRLLYAYGFLKRPRNFENYRYFFRYYPKMVVPIYEQRQNSREIFQQPSYHWILGTHWQRDREHHISYNVAVEVNLRTIIEEELHGQIEGLHDTTTVSNIVEDIENQMPELKKEIEQNLNRILSTEEKKFQDLGEVLSVENASEIRILEQFVIKFETEVIENTEI